MDKMRTIHHSVILNLPAQRQFIFRRHVIYEVGLDFI